MFPLVLGLSAVLGASALSAVSYSYIKIVPSQTALVSGDEFTIKVYAFAHVPVNAVDISLAFSGDAVDITSVDTGDSVITLWTEEPHVVGSTVIMRGGTFQRGFKGEHLIATIKATAKHSGPVDFSVANLSLLAGDGKGTPVLTGTPESSKTSLYVDNVGSNGAPGSLKASAEVAVVTDINGDGKVSLGDISAFLAAWHSSDRVYDFNNDGQMTFRDFAIILADSFLAQVKN